MIGNAMAHMNYLSLVIAALAYFFLGAVWYSKALFATQWMALNNINMDNPEARKGVIGMMLTTFVLTLIICICMWVLVYGIGLYGVMHGIKLGLLCSVGFSATTISMSYIYLRKPTMLYVIDCGYHVVGMIIAGSVLCGMH